MKEIRGDLWDYFGKDWTVICITTNGTVKKNGEAVMGRGCAAETKTKFPDIPFELGNKIRKHGNIVQSLLSADEEIISFPVKHQWWEEADLELIKKSAQKLKEIAENNQDLGFVLPRPGCGNGKLNWKQVKPLLVDLPDNVLVITR